MSNIPKSDPDPRAPDAARPIDRLREALTAFVKRAHTVWPSISPSILSALEDLLQDSALFGALQEIDPLRDRIEALRRQPHVAPCLKGYGDRHQGAECSCWLGQAIEFLEAPSGGAPAAEPFNIGDELHALLTLHSLPSRTDHIALWSDLIGFMARVFKQQRQLEAAAVSPVPASPPSVAEPET